MSRHSIDSKRRDMDGKGREHFKVSHVTFEIHAGERTFALIAGEAAYKKDIRPLFTGHFDKSMAAELRRLADRIDEIG